MSTDLSERPDLPERVAQELAAIGEVTEQQHQLVARCARFLEQRVPGDDPLWSSCVHAQECWRRDRGDRPQPMLPRIPFIGPSYPEHRVAVVAINSRDSGKPHAEIATTRAVLRELRAGRREYGRNSYFHYRVAATVLAIQTSLKGQPVETVPSPARAADALLGSARLQAIQCSPTATSRRTPTPEMVEHCPEFILRGLLAIVDPAVLVLLGQPAHQAIEAPPLEMNWRTTWRESGNCFSRGETVLNERPLTVLALHHPSATGWPKSWRALTTSLTERPLSLPA